MFGVPGRHARMLRNRALMNMVAVSFVALPVIAWWAAGPTSLTRVVAAVIGVATVISVVYDLSGNYHRARAGVMSETQVVRALKRSGVAAVVNGALLVERSGDADHVVLGPMVAVVETKTGRGAVTVVGDTVRCGRKLLPGRPMHQTRLQAKGLARFTGLDAAAVLCVVSMDGPPRTEAGVTICSAADLPAVLARLPHRLDRTDAVTIASRIPLAD